MSLIGTFGRHEDHHPVKQRTTKFGRGKDQSHEVLMINEWNGKHFRDVRSIKNTPQDIKVITKDVPPHPLRKIPETKDHKYKMRQSRLQAILEGDRLIGSLIKRVKPPLTQGGVASEQKQEEFARRIGEIGPELPSEQMQLEFARSLEPEYKTPVKPTRELPPLTPMTPAPKPEARRHLAPPSPVSSRPTELRSGAQQESALSSLFSWGQKSETEEKHKKLAKEVASEFNKELEQKVMSSWERRREVEKTLESLEETLRVMEGKTGVKVGFKLIDDTYSKFFPNQPKPKSPQSMLNHIVNYLKGNINLLKKQLGGGGGSLRRGGGGASRATLSRGGSRVSRRQRRPSEGGVLKGRGLKHSKVKEMKVGDTFDDIVPRAKRGKGSSKKIAQLIGEQLPKPKYTKRKHQTKQYKEIKKLVVAQPKGSGLLVSRKILKSALSKSKQPTSQAVRNLFQDLKEIDTIKSASKRSFKSKKSRKV